MVLKFYILLIVSQTFGSELSRLCKNYKKYASYHLLDHGDKCGIVTKTNDIMGGKDASIGEFPFMALVLLKDKKDFNTLCGGSIINNQYVLTAAHCFSRFYRKLKRKHHILYARLGAHYLVCKAGDSDDNHDPFCASKPIDIEVKDVVIHSGYDPRVINNDIALLRLKEKMIFSERISPICLPLDCKFIKQNLVGQEMTLAGWGDTAVGKNEKGNKGVLQKVQLHITSNEGCKKDWRKDILETHICAGGTREYNEDKKIKDACKGDSGGPLFYPTKLRGSNIRYVQVAVVSGGDNCNPRATEVNAGLYTRVTAYIPWILQHVKK